MKKRYLHFYVSITVLLLIYPTSKIYSWNSFSHRDLMFFCQISKDLESDSVFKNNIKEIIFPKQNYYYADYYENNELLCIKLKHKHIFCEANNPNYKKYLLIIQNMSKKWYLYNCSDSDRCDYYSNNLIDSAAFDKEILGFLKNDNCFNFDNIIRSYSKITFLYNLISYSELETLNLDFTKVFRLIHPKVQLTYPILNINDLKLFRKIISYQEFMGHYLKIRSSLYRIMRIDDKNAIYVERGFELGYHYEKIDSLNKKFLNSYIECIKEDITRNRAFYLYSIPDLKLVKVWFQVKNSKITVYKKYINHNFIWDKRNSDRINNVKYFW
jgi:hypothetical protein